MTADEVSLHAYTSNVSSDIREWSNLILQSDILFVALHPDVKLYISVDSFSGRISYEARFLSNSY